MGAQGVAPSKISAVESGTLGPFRPGMKEFNDQYQTPDSAVSTVDVSGQ